jgi:hypothetical protein
VQPATRAPRPTAPHVDFGIREEGSTLYMTQLLTCPDY